MCTNVQTKPTVPVQRNLYCPARTNFTNQPFTNSSHIDTKHMVQILKGINCLATLPDHRLKHTVVYCNKVQLKKKF